MAHTTREGLKKSSRSVQEIQRDIKTMEDEKEQVSQKLSNVKRKVNCKSNYWQANTGPSLMQLTITLTLISLSVYFAHDVSRSSNLTLSGFKPFMPNPIPFDFFIIVRVAHFNLSFHSFLLLIRGSFKQQAVLCTHHLYFLHTHSLVSSLSCLSFLS